VQHLGFSKGGEEIEVEMRIGFGFGFGLVGFWDGVFVIAPFPHHGVEFVSVKKGAERNEEIKGK